VGRRAAVLATKSEEVNNRTRRYFREFVWFGLFQINPTYQE